MKLKTKLASLGILAVVGAAVLALVFTGKSSPKKIIYTDPDFSIKILILDTFIIDNNKYDFVLSVSEQNNITPNNTPLEVFIPKGVVQIDNFDNSLSSLLGIKTNNSNWEFDSSNDEYYKFIFKGIQPALSKNSIGIKASFNINNKKDIYLEAYISDGSGGEINFDNNKNVVKLSIL